MKRETDNDTALIQIPFPGFYESWLSQELDREEENFIEYEAEYRQAEEGVPAELRLDAKELADIMWRCSDHTKAYEPIAKEYVEEFSNWLAFNYELDLGLTFSDMSSPKYYNFETDRVFAHMPMRKVYLMFAISKRDKHRTLKEVIRSRHTSYDGFHSHYDNDLEEWLEKDVYEWDHNELHTLLLTVMKLRGVDDSEFLYHMLDGDGFYQHWSDCVDWEQWEERVQEKRDELIEELKDENGEDYEPPYRCNQTPDMFAQEMRP